MGIPAPRLRRRRPGLDAGGDRLRTGAAKLVGTAQRRPRNAGDRERVPVEKMRETKMGVFFTGNHDFSHEVSLLHIIARVSRIFCP